MVDRRTRLYSGAVVLAAVLSGCSCGVAVRGVADEIREAKAVTSPGQGRHGAVIGSLQTSAQVAWKYFENNIKPQTGTASFKDGYPIATLSSAADTLAAIYAAREFGFITEEQAYDRVGNIVAFLNSMELIEGRVPNLTYNTETGKMVNESNAAAAVGWSSVDMGRLLTWLRIVRARFPRKAEYIDRVVLRWNICDALDRCGMTYSGRVQGNTFEAYEEGNLGYQEYAALGFGAWGYPVAEALSVQPAESVRIGGFEILHDARDPRLTHTFAPVVTQPHALTGIEYAWKMPNSMAGNPDLNRLHDIADTVFKVQQDRFQRDMVLTARTDHALGRAPYFVWDTIYLAGYPWNTISNTGEYAPQEALLSTRAIFGMWILWPGHYTDRLMREIRRLYDPGKGWYEGVLELTGGTEHSITSATNATILEALLYLSHGPLYRGYGPALFFSKQLRERVGGPAACYAPVRVTCNLQTGAQPASIQ